MQYFTYFPTFIFQSSTFSSTFASRILGKWDAFSLVASYSVCSLLAAAETESNWKQEQRPQAKVCQYAPFTEGGANAAKPTARDWQPPLPCRLDQRGGAAVSPRYRNLLFMQPCWRQAPFSLPIARRIVDSCKNRRPIQSMWWCTR